MPFFAPNPNVGTGGAPVATPPMPGQYPGGNWLMQQYWEKLRQAPWLFPQNGLLNQTPYAEPQGPGGLPVMPQRGLLSPVADIYKFPPKGPGMLGATEGAGGRGLGSRGGGMLGSQWRDPRFIQNYEVQQGLRPGSLQQPSAPVTPIAPPGGRQMDFGKYNAKVTDPRMLTPEARTEAAKAGRLPFDVPYKPGPTPAQMARPVMQTPEISAKLAEARAKRAADQFTGRLVMTRDVWKVMGEPARTRWLEAQGAGTWTPQQRAAFARLVGGIEK